MLYAVNTQKLPDQNIQLRFEPHIFHFLNITPLETTVGEDTFDCSFACIRNNLCISFNLAVSADEKGKLWCELLPSSIYNNTAKLDSYGQSNHYSLQVGDKKNCEYVYFQFSLWLDFAESVGFVSIAGSNLGNLKRSGFSGAIYISVSRRQLKHIYEHRKTQHHNRFNI